MSDDDREHDQEVEHEVEREEDDGGRDRDRDRGRDRDRDRDRDRHRDRRSRRRRSRRDRSKSPPRDRDRSKSRDRDRDRDRRRDRGEKKEKKKSMWDVAEPAPGTVHTPPAALALTGEPLQPGMSEHSAPSGFSSAPPAGMPGVPPRPSPTEAAKNKTLYIGNVQPNMTDVFLRTFFTQEITKLGQPDPYGAQVVDRVTVNHEKFFAFIDFGSNGYAEQALTMDGVYVQGHEIRVRRPNGGGGAPAAAQAEAPAEPVITEGIYTENGLLSLGSSAQEKLRQRFNVVSSRAPPVPAKEEVYDY